MSPKVLCDVVWTVATRPGLGKLAPHDLRRTSPDLAIWPVGVRPFCSGTSRLRRRNGAWGARETVFGEIAPS